MNRTDRLVRIYVASDAAALPAPPARGPVSIETTSRDEDADVWVVGAAPGAREPFQPPTAVAVLRVTEADAGTDLAGPPADHQVTREVFQADPVASVQEALDQRIARRPCARDSVEGWLESVRRVLGADGAALVGGGPSLRAGTIDDPATFDGPARPWFATGLPAAERLPGADGVIVWPVRWRDRAGALVLTVREGGAAWVQRIRHDVRGIVAAAEAHAGARRDARLDGHLGLVRSMLGVAVHDLRGAQFGLELGTRLLARVAGTEQLRGNLAGSVGGPLNQVKLSLAAVRELLEAPEDEPGGTASLGEVWDRTLGAVAKEHPARTKEISATGEPPKPLLAAPAGAVARVLRSLLDNALAHAPADAPIRVSWSERDGLARVEIRNPGKLPFDDLAQIAPFKHRAKGRAGLGLWLARSAAEAAGIALEVRQDGDEVLAVAAFPTTGAEQPA